MGMKLFLELLLAVVTCSLLVISVFSLPLSSDSHLTNTIPKYVLHISSQTDIVGLMIGAHQLLVQVKV